MQMHILRMKSYSQFNCKTTLLVYDFILGTRELKFIFMQLHYCRLLYPSHLSCFVGYARISRVIFTCTDMCCLLLADWLLTFIVTFIVSFKLSVDYIWYKYLN